VKLVRLWRICGEKKIMFIELKLGHDFRQTVGDLSRMGSDVLQAVSRELGKGAKFAAGNVKQNYLRGQSLKRRSGNLARAVDGWLASPFDGVVGIQENAAVSKYAWLLSDEQKTIVPKKSKFLTIPIGENLTMAGVARYSSPREVPNGFFVQTGGQLLFGYKNGKKGKFRALFVLVKSVLVQGSGALYEGVNECVDKITENIQGKIYERIGT